MIPRTHPLASVRDAFNAVFVEAEAAGQLMFYGRGAGGAPTASAVLGDLVAVARNRLAGVRGGGRVGVRRPRGAADGRDPHPLPRRLDVADRAGVLAAVASVFAEHDVSIQTVRQEGRGDDATLVVVTHAAHRRRAARDRRGAARAGHRPRGDQGDAGRREATNERQPRPTSGAGVIEEYRDRLPVPTATPVVTLREGGTPLVPAPCSPSVTGCEVYLKVEGANPTGSFKDRGMTVAVSKAVEEGAKAVICASTGNTSASAAAYAARAGLNRSCWSRRARSRSASWPRRSCTAPGCQVARQLRRLPARWPASWPSDYPVALVNSVNPVRLEGQKTAAFEIVDGARRRPGHPLPAGRQRRQHLRLLDGLPASTPTPAARPKRPRMCGFQAEGAAPIVTGESFPQPATIATAIRIGNPASWTKPSRPRDESGGRHRGGHRRGDPRRVASARPPATASSSSRPPRPAWPACSQAVAGGESRRLDRGLHGHRPRPQGPRDGPGGVRPTSSTPSWTPTSPRPRRRRAAPDAARSSTGPVRVSVPATSANLGPGFDALGLALGLRDELVAQVQPEGLVVEVDGRGRRRRAARRVAPGRPRDARGLRPDGRRSRPACGWRVAT